MKAQVVGSKFFIRARPRALDEPLHSASCMRRGVVLRGAIPPPSCGAVNDAAGATGCLQKCHSTSPTWDLYANRPTSNDSIDVLVNHAAFLSRPDGCWHIEGRFNHAVAGPGQLSCSAGFQSSSCAPWRDEDWLSRCTRSAESIYAMVDNPEIAAGELFV